MKKKHPPEQYTAKPKPVAVKPLAKPSEHPAVVVAKKLIGWLDRGDVPPSVVLLHGLHFARSRENDGLPVDTFRPLIQMQGNDNRSISEVMDILAQPQAAKAKVIAAWLQANWVNKSRSKSQPPPNPIKAQKSTAAKKTEKPSKIRSTPPVKKTVVIIKKK
jgi:hypothetical protein